MDKSCTKILLFDTALELFRKFGYDTVSVSRICSESGLTRNAFYYYFPSKDALLSSFFENIPVFTEKLISDMLLLPNDWVKLWFLFEAHLKLIESEGLSICRAFIKINTDGGGDLLMNYSFSENVCVPLIRSCQKQGLIRNMTDPSRLDYIATRMLSGILLAWCCKNGSFDLVAESKAAFFSLMYPAVAS